MINDQMTPMTDDERIDALRTMMRIRRFEERVGKLFTQGRLPGFVHLYIGQEAVAVGASAGLQDGDQITSTHRGHGHVIARGGDVFRMFAELLGRRDGYCGGKGGSMHIVDFQAGMLGTNGIVGGGIPIATGAAFANRHLGNNRVAVAFFGDGATNQGVLFEAFNLAALWSLPVVFLCEHNQYTEWSPTDTLTAGSIPERSRPFGVPSLTVDGNDVDAVRDAVLAAAARARAGEGPTFIEAHTYRHTGHNEGEEAFAGNYRPAEEVARWKQRDPITLLRQRLADTGALDAAGADAIDEQEQARVEDALAAAQQAAPPDPEDAVSDVFAAAH